MEHCCGSQCLKIPRLSQASALEGACILRVGGCHSGVLPWPCVCVCIYKYTPHNYAYIGVCVHIYIYISLSLSLSPSRSLVYTHIICRFIATVR